MRPTPYLQPPEHEEYDQDYEEIIEWEEQMDFSMQMNYEAEVENLQRIISSYVKEKVTI